MSWEDFWTGANSTFEQGANIGSDIYLKKLAAKIQARNQDKQNLWESIQADNKKKADAEEWDRRNRITTETNQRWVQTQAERTANEQFDAVNYLIDAKGYRDKIGEFPKTMAGVKAAEARMKELDDAAKPKDKETFNADETLYRLLGPEKWLEYKTKSGSSDNGEMKRYRAQGEANDMAKSIIAKEEGNLPARVDELSAVSPSSDHYEKFQAELGQIKPQLDAIRANRPGGEVALTDSLSYGQGQYATPEQQNQLVDPQKEMSILEKIAAMNAKLDAVLKKVNGGK